MDIRKMAREELERRQAEDELDPVVYIGDADDPDHKPLTPEERRLMRAALAEGGISQIIVRYEEGGPADAKQGELKRGHT